MIYVGIDPSLNRPGLAVLDASGKPLLVTSLSVSRKCRGAERLHGHWAWVWQSLKGVAAPLACGLEQALGRVAAQVVEHCPTGALTWDG